MRICCSLLLLLSLTAFAQKYAGPRPPKPDVVYLVHADNLVPTEVTEAKQDSKKNEIQFTVAGTGSSARTPLAEPIFIIESEKIQPQSLELYKFEVKNGHREVTMVQRRTRGGPRPLRLTVTRLDGKLYKIEADEEIENGQYGLSPNGSNTVFCFEVY
ncbi:MAG TPA: hypothetical protein VNX18_21370 [Bryobacteraceae bacterium]|jgi:hypothetical protein|nr:hypothetical protein [Bryobacteraceae bacterium]